MTALRSRARSLISAWSRLSSWGAAMPKHKRQRAGVTVYQRPLCRKKRSLRQTDELPEERPRGFGIEAVVHVRRPAVRVARYGRGRKHQRVVDGEKVRTTRVAETRSAISRRWIL